ncbi:MAG: hypothetical protein E6Q95_03195 [Chitinophagaceae bacterium]|nr:MAG: hypothetical protein E6Q95_03195 [Chitinophagaceae bacterium]
MKKAAILLSIFFISSGVQAQVADTALYLNSEILAKKHLFIGKPFSVLLDTLKVTPKLNFGRSPRYNKNIESRSYFYFNEGVSRSAHYIVIEWEDPISATVTESLHRKNNFVFTGEERAFYCTRTVADIIFAK